MRLRRAGFPVPDALRFMLRLPDRSPPSDTDKRASQSVGSAPRASSVPLAPLSASSLGMVAPLLTVRRSRSAGLRSPQTHGHDCFVDLLIHLLRVTGTFATIMTDRSCQGAHVLPQGVDIA